MPEPEIESTLKLCNIDFLQLAQIAYVRRSQKDQGMWMLEFLTTEASTAHVRTLSNEAMGRFWNVFTSLLTEHMSPGCVPCGKEAYLQLAYLERCQLVLYQERYVVLLHFTGGGVVQIWVHSKEHGERIMAGFTQLMNGDDAPPPKHFH